MAQPIMDEYGAEQQVIGRQRKMADILREQAMQQPQGQMIGNQYVAPSWTQQLATALKGFGATKMERDADAKEKALYQKSVDRRNADLANILAAGNPIPAAPDYSSTEFGPDVTMPGTPGREKTPEEKRQALTAALMGAQSPEFQQLGLTQAIKDMTPENVVVGRSLLDKRTGRLIGEDSTWQGEQQAAREQKIAELTLRLEDQKLAREDRAALQRELAQQSADLRRQLAAQASADRRAAQQAGNKPPPGYRWLPDGSGQEVIPGGPADVKAQAAANMKATGATDVDVSLSTLRDAYDRLEKGGGITSTNKSGWENAKAAASSSGVGQVVGKALGTDNQSARNDIAMARPALLAALMKATGMSAKQMDSNAELKLWLSTATDPTLDIESNRRALANIEKKYLRGGAPPPPPRYTYASRCNASVPE